MAKRIVLDTSVAREFCYSEPSWFKTYLKMKEEGWSFHLSEVAFAEMIAAIERNSINQDNLAQGLAGLDKILDTELPCLPTKKRLLDLCEVVDRERDSGDVRSKEFLHGHSRAAWDALKQLAISAEERKEITFEADGRTYKCPLKGGVAAELMEQERKNWIDHMSGPIQVHSDYNTEVAAEKAHCDDWARSSSPPMSVRCDIVVHAIVELTRRRKDGYSPTSSKRRNDGIDLILSFAFMWPALLVTADKKLYKLLRALRSYQANWSYLNDELAKKFQEGALQEPVWPVV